VTKRRSGESLLSENLSLGDIDQFIVDTEIQSSPRNEAEVLDLQDRGKGFLLFHESPGSLDKTRHLSIRVHAHQNSHDLSRRFINHSSSHILLKIIINYREKPNVLEIFNYIDNTPFFSITIECSRHRDSRNKSSYFG
jgi:hypothetical protein